MKANKIKVLKKEIKYLKNSLKIEMLRYCKENKDIIKKSPKNYMAIFYL